MTSTITCSSIKLKDITEVFQDYRKPSLFLCVCGCDWKCCTEAGIPVTTCQNHKIQSQRPVEVPFKDILDLFNKGFMKAIIVGGLEPFLQKDELLALIRYLRYNGVSADIVIYTGYYPEEIEEQVLNDIISNHNIIIKYGRFKPDFDSRYDDVLGVTLASSNQYAVKYS